MERYVRTVKTDYHTPIEVGNRELDNRFSSDHVVIMPTGGTTGPTTSQAMDFAKVLLEVVKVVREA